jgi:hypothetical protein
MSTSVEMWADAVPPATVLPVTSITCGSHSIFVWWLLASVNVLALWRCAASAELRTPRAAAEAAVWLSSSN